MPIFLCLFASMFLFLFSFILTFFLSFVLLFSLCFSFLLLLRFCSSLYVTLVAKMNTKTLLMHKGSSNYGDEMSRTCSTHRKMRSGYKYLIEKLRFRWSRGSVLAFGTPSSRVQTRPKPSDFSGWKKVLSTPSFGGEVKPSVPCRRFTACKRSLNVTWKSGIFRQNSSAIYRPCSSTFGC